MEKLFWEIDSSPVTISHDGNAFYFGDQFLSKSLSTAVDKMSKIHRAPKESPKPKAKPAEFKKMGDLVFDESSGKHFEDVTGDRIFLAYDRDEAFDELDKLKKEMALNGE